MDEREFRNRRKIVWCIVAFSAALASEAVAQLPFMSRLTVPTKPGVGVIVRGNDASESLLVIQNVADAFPAKDKLDVTFDDYASFGRFCDDDNPFHVVIERGSRAAHDQWCRRRRFPAGTPQPGEFLVGRFRVVFVVDRSNPIRSLDFARIRMALSQPSKDSKWRDIGGAGTAAVRCYGMPEKTQARQLIQAKCMTRWRDTEIPGVCELEKLGFRDDLVACADAKEVIAKVRGDRSALGFLALGEELTDQMLLGVKVLPVAATEDDEAVAPTLEAVVGEAYPLSEPVYLYVHPDAPKEAWDFCKFATGPEAVEIIKQAGLRSGYELAQIQAQRRLAEAKSTKAAEIVTCDLTGSEGVLNELATEFVKAKAAVRLHFQKKTTRDAAIERLFKGETELLLLDEPMSALERRNEAGVPQSVPRTIELGRIAAGIVVHPENPLESMSLDEVRSIFSGEVRKWPAVRGAAPVIHVYGLAHTDRITQLLKEKLDVRTLRFSIEPDVEKVVLAVARDPAAIGFVDLARLSPAEKSVKLVPVLLPGQTLPKPTTEAKDAEPKQAKGKGAKNKSSKSQAKAETDQPAASPELPNPFSRTLVLYVSSNASQAAKDFADFLTPEHCAETLTRHGLLPPLPAASAVASSQSREKQSSLAAISGPNIGSQSIPLDWEPPEVREERERREAEEAQRAASPSRPPQAATSTSQGTKTSDNSARPPADPREQTSKPIVPGLSNIEVLWLTGGVAGVVVFAVFAGWFNAARRRKKR